MSRRRRTREPAFGSDSFLDVIANLVGIVIILIVMVGGQVRELPILTSQADTQNPHPQLSSLPLEIQRYNAKVAELQNRLVEIVRSLELAQRDHQCAVKERRELLDRHAAANELLASYDQTIATYQGAVTTVEQQKVSLEQRLAELQKVITELEAKPPDRWLLRLHLPVSRPVSAEELLFECREGRVTHADVQTLLTQVRDGLQEKAAVLRDRWETSDSVGPVGPFRLEYTLERERSSPLEQAFGDLAPTDEHRFSYAVTRWELVPVWPVRGETLQEALAAGSRFQQIVDVVDPEQVVLTFFVYPDSFELFRALRDRLYEQGFVVAGRPLPPYQRITGSRNGSVSHGQ